MKKTEEALRCVVGPETVRMLELGHPWVIADRFTRSWPKFSNGALLHIYDEKNRFYGTALGDPQDRIVARMLDHAKIRLDRNWLVSRLGAAVDLRRQHALCEKTTAYRLVNAEGDFLPGLTVDRYSDHIMIQLYSEAWRPYLPSIASVLSELLDPAGLYEKPRPRQTRELGGKGEKKLSRLLAGRPAPGRSIVQENGLDFYVELEDGLNTGLFLDQRNNRRDLMQRVQERRVLNLFAYTGAFSVAAAAAGARQVTSVDVSSTYLGWAQENFRLNRIRPEEHRFITGDCLQTLAILQREKQIYDVIIMDPPSFSTTGKSRFTTRQGTSELAAAALPLLADGGLFITCSNHQKVELADYLKELRRGALTAQTDLRVIQTPGQPEDFPFPVTFPEGRYLKYVMAVKGRGRTA